MLSPPSAQELLTCLSVNDRVGSSSFAARMALSYMGVGVMEEREFCKRLDMVIAWILETKGLEKCSAVKNGC